VHSPVTVLATNSQGQKIGTQLDNQYDEIINASYFEFADSKYMVIPEDDTYTITLEGYATSTYSLTIDSLQGDTQRPIGMLMGASTTPYMSGKFIIEQGVVGDVVVDSNGNGQIDYIGDFVSNSISYLSAVEVTIPTTPNNKKSSGTLLREQPIPLVAGAATSTAPDQEYLQLVSELLQLVQQYLDLLSKK